MKLAPRIALLCVSFAVGTAFCDQIAVSSFKYLNSNENSVIIDPSEAQDLLNVDISPGGKSVKKRSGYGIYKSLGTSQGVHGGYHLFDSTGNDVQLWGSSTTLKGIVADGVVNAIISSATLGSTWDCTDTQGSAYCVNSNRDGLIKTNGVTFTSWAAPNGTMIEATPDRIAVAGVTGALSSIYVSASNSFLNYTPAPLTTDPFIEPIAAPGSKLTHIRWACGKLLWWKDQSFGYMTFDDQYALQIKIVSDNIGTFDNTSAVDPGGSVWFRGQDGHLWQYDCSGLIKQTIEITPQIQASGRRTSNFWTQTSQSDWQTGSVIPTGQLSTTISDGDITVSSYTVTENSASSGWSSGSSSNMAVGTSSISLSINNSGNITDNGFESDTPPTYTTNWTTVNINAFLTRTTYAARDCTILPQAGSNYAGGSTVASSVPTVQIIDAVSGSILDSKAIPKNNPCAWVLDSVTPSASTIGKRVKYRFTGWDAGLGNESITTASSYINGGALSYYRRCDCADGSCSTLGCAIDTITNGSSTINSGSFTSQVFNTGLTSATYSLSNFAWTVNTSTPTFALLTSTANPSNNWVSILTSSSTNAVGNKYVRYVSTIAVTSIDNALTSITAATILARSSGTFVSAWKNVPTWTAWSTFNPTYSNGDGSHTFYVRSSTSSQAVLNSTITWVAQPENALVATSTPGIYFQIRDDFSIGAATNTPTLNSFLANWFEGSSTDQSYMLYFDNSIWASVAYGVGVSSNTYIFRRDLINDGWTVYNFGTGGMLVQNNHLFFGDVSVGGNVFQYGSGTSDNTTAITAYWKSKDFSGADPFVSNQLSQIDVFSKQNTGQSLTATYATDTSTTTTSYAINLSTTSQSIIQSRKLLPAGKNGYVFNLKLGDATATSAWEVLGFRIGYVTQSYRPSQ